MTTVTLNSSELRHSEAAQIATIHKLAAALDRAVDDQVYELEPAGPDEASA